MFRIVSKVKPLFCALVRYTYFVPVHPKHFPMGSVFPPAMQIEIAAFYGGFLYQCTSPDVGCTQNVVTSIFFPSTGSSTWLDNIQRCHSPIMKNQEIWQMSKYGYQIQWLDFGCKQVYVHWSEILQIEKKPVLPVPDFKLSPVQSQWASCSKSGKD